MVSDARRASEVLRRIRGLVKATSTERGPVDVNDTIDEVLALTRHEPHRYRASVDAALDPNLPSVRADRIQVQQVILNLVMNGIEAMREISDRPRVLTLK